MRWNSELNLIEIAAKQGAELQFDRYRRDLESADFSPQLRIVYLTHVGRGYHALGSPRPVFRTSSAPSRWPRPTASIRCCSRLSRRWWRYNRAAVAAHRTPLEVTESTQDVIGFIGGMKQLAGVG